MNHYLKNIQRNTDNQGNMYLDLFTDRRLKEYQQEAWFQEALDFEKGKYDALLRQYPRASTILE